MGIKAVNTILISVKDLGNLEKLDLRIKYIKFSSL